VSTEHTLVPPLSEEALTLLWHAGWLIARKACTGTLVRLNRGLGGLYEGSDFQQDAYLTFRALALRWAQQDPRPLEGELWSTWRRALQHGGAAILRCPPQRLWIAARPESIDLEAVADDPGLCNDAALVRAVSEQLVDRTDPAEMTEQAQDLASKRAAVRRGLEALMPAQRSLVTAVVLEGRPIQDVAAELGISLRATRMRLARALAVLRRFARDALRSQGAGSPMDDERDACARTNLLP
jgi:hypothetical protein